MTPCLDCEAALDVPEDAIVGEIVPCGACGAEFEVRKTNPLVIEPAPEISEDWGE